MVSVVNVCLNLVVRIENRLAEAEEQAAAAAAAQQEEGSGTPTREQLAQMALQRALGGGNGAAAGNFNPADLLRFVQSLQQQQTPQGGGGDAD